jgi:hypothetical protein
MRNAECGMRSDGGKCGARSDGGKCGARSSECGVTAFGDSALIDFTRRRGGGERNMGGGGDGNGTCRTVWADFVL